jgi:hypothetical protein
MPVPKYPLPAFLIGIMTLLQYDKWLQVRAESLFKLDKARKRPYAIAGSIPMYKEKIHEAVLKNGTIDPFMGDPLNWELVQKWDSTKDKGHGNFLKEFYFMPTVDHIDPYGDTLEFEICSWLSNDCKNDQTPEEFIKMCRDVAAYRTMPGPTAYAKPASLEPLGAAHRIYFLPFFLTGICTLAVYMEWLAQRAYKLHKRDREQGRPYGLAGSISSYKKAVHAAVIAAGLLDPFTGETMRWELIGTWNDNDHTNAKKKDFYLMPTVDHVDPYAEVLELEICSWRINESKSNLTPDEFVDVCRKVAARAS